MGRSMRSATRTVLVLLVLASCTNGSGSVPEASTTTLEIPDSDVTTTTAAPATTGSTTTTTEVTDPVIEIPSGAGVLITYDDALSIRLPNGDSLSLTGDFEVPLATAFDDLNGGIVFQYANSSTALDDPILHLPNSSGDPLILVAPADGHRLTLVDVDIFDGRLVAMYLDRAADGAQTINTVGLDGGSPRKLEEGRAFLSGSLSSDRYSFTQQSTGCRIGVIKDTSGAETSRWACPGGAIGLRLGESNVAWIAQDGIELADLAGETADSPWSDGDRATAQLFDFNGSAATTRASTTAFRYLSIDGSSTRFETSRRIRSVTLLRAPVTVAPTASLGGISAPDGQCSGSGFPATPSAIDGLTLAATETRAAIVAAANACDFGALQDVADPAMIAPSDPDLARYWIGREQQRFDDLSVMIRLLNLPFTQGTDASGEPVFIWPAAAASEDPTEQEWQALGAVYNEEDIESMRQAGMYRGAVMMIGLDGRWLSGGIPPE